jgi:hypothetical protein
VGEEGGEAEDGGRLEHEIPLLIGDACLEAFFIPGQYGQRPAARTPVIEARRRGPAGGRVRTDR